MQVLGKLFEAPGGGEELDENFFSPFSGYFPVTRDSYTHFLVNFDQIRFTSCHKSFYWITVEAYEGLILLKIWISAPSLISCNQIQLTSYYKIVRIDLPQK